MSHLGASPRTRAGACHASGHDSALAPLKKTTARPALGATAIPGAPSPETKTPFGAPGRVFERLFRDSNLSSQSATAAASRASSAPAQATCTPRAPSEASASATGSRASLAFVERDESVVVDFFFSEPISAQGKNVSPPASSPTSLRYTKTVHVRRSSRLWSWCTLIRAAPLFSSASAPARDTSDSTLFPVSGASKPSESTLAASSSSRAASSSSSFGGKRDVRASITQSPSSFAGTPVKIAALRARSAAAAICKPAASAER